MHIQPLHLKHESRNGFYTDLPGQFNWKLFLPSKSTMIFSIGINQNYLNSIPKHLTLIIKEQNSNKLLLKKKLKSFRLGRHFKEFSINLDNFSNKITNLNFELKPNSKNFKSISNAIYWEQPKILFKSDKIEKNIIIITIDTLRADHLSYNGYFRKTSANIDKFASKSLNFSNAFSVSSATWPALTSLMTSVYPSQHGVIFNGYKLTKKIISLPEILQNNNYYTSAILGNMRRATHYGYDYIFKAPSDEVLVSRTLSKIEQLKNRKFFLWVHFLGPHAPYSAPKYYYSKYNITPEDANLGQITTHYKLFENQEVLPPDILHKIIQLYDINIEYTDYLVGLILDKIYQLNLHKNTIIILSADHGEELCQHFNYLYHSGSLYDSSLNIPLLIHIPNSKSKITKINSIVSIIDIAPTILDLVDIPIPRSFKGESLLKTLSKRPLDRDYAFSETNASLFSIRNKEWRTISNPTRKPLNIMTLFQLNYSDELYQHPADSLELNNVAAQKLNVYKQYDIFLKNWIANNLPSQVPSQMLDSETIEQLKALGYIR
jgi:arylsulfatase A-like enzyme